MATLTSAAGRAVSPDNSKKRRRPRHGSGMWRWAVMIIAGVYFLVPLYAALRFAGLSGFKDVFTTPGFASSLWLSVKLAAVTWIVSMLLMIPTTVYVHLRMPGLRRLLEGVTILPIVIPPVVLIIGVLQVMPLALRASVWMLGLEYVILAMPFAYRALDAGLRSIDVKTLTEAAGSLGAGWLSTMWRVILPNMRTAVISATILIVALVLGEFTMASLDLYQTFPVWIVAFDQTSGPVSTAASLLALFVTWLFLMLIVTVGSRRARRTGGGQVDLISVTRQDTSRPRIEES